MYQECHWEAIPHRGDGDRGITGGQAYLLSYGGGDVGDQEVDTFLGQRRSLSGTGEVAG